jgi:hypothetical protein
MIRHNLIRGIAIDENIEEKQCHVCNIMKSKADNHPRGRQKTTKIGEVIHTDLCGPMPVTGRGGYRYFQVFIDDKVSICEVTLLRKKSEAAEAIKTFTKRFERKYDCKVKNFRHDRGTEFLNKTISKYCNETGKKNEVNLILTKQGIVQQKTDGHTPEQNSIAERKIYTLCSGGGAMMRTGKMPKMFWTDAILTMNYVLNRTMTKANEGEVSPMEAVMKKSPDLSRLATFGSIAYAHVPKVLRKKFDDTAIACRFIGYSSEHTQDRNGGSSVYFIIKC